jgi:hypothetical protein
MNDSVLGQRIGMAGWAAGPLLVWAVIESPRGSWPGLLFTTALAALLVAGVTLFIGRRTEEAKPHLSDIISGIDAEPAASRVATAAVSPVGLQPDAPL